MASVYRCGHCGDVSTTHVYMLQHESIILLSAHCRAHPSTWSDDARIVVVSSRSTLAEVRSLLLVNEVMIT